MSEVNNYRLCLITLILISRANNRLQLHQEKMQARQINQKPKFKLKQFAATGNYPTNKFSYQSKDGSCKLYCICNQFNLAKSRKCSRCSESYHSCVAFKSENSANWQCLHCESIYMDPIYWPENILLETFYKTQTVTQYGNTFDFTFFVNQQQAKKPIQIRGLQDGRQGLAWPMIGQFYLNKDQYPDPIIDIKPLLKNSNRKHRKQQALFLPQDKLKVGKNTLTFSIPKINSLIYEPKYQIQLKGIYFIGIYSIKKLAKEQLIKKIFQTSKMQKAASLEFLKRSSMGFAELSVEKSVICLQCPYMKSRIKIPVRGKHCSHYTCICLETLIQTRIGMNSREWVCPICSSPINEPIVDMFILSILNDGSAGIKVSLNINGQYEWIQYQDDNSSNSSHTPKQKPQVVEQVPKQKNLIDDNSKNVEKVIQTIHIDDDQVRQVPSHRPAVQPIMRTTTVASVDVEKQIAGPVASKSTVPFHRKKQQNQATKSSKNAVLQIMIPEQKQVGNKKQRIQLIKQSLQQEVKEKKKKEMPEVFLRQNPGKQEFYITDIPSISFRSLTHHEFAKRYFNIEYKRNKIHDDLKTIFKEVI